MHAQDRVKALFDSGIQLVISVLRPAYCEAFPRLGHVLRYRAHGGLRTRDDGTFTHVNANNTRLQAIQTCAPISQISKHHADTTIPEIPSFPGTLSQIITMAKRKAVQATASVREYLPRKAKGGIEPREVELDTVDPTPQPRPQKRQKRQKTKATPRKKTAILKPAPPPGHTCVLCSELKPASAFPPIEHIRPSCQQDFQRTHLCQDCMERSFKMQFQLNSGPSDVAKVPVHLLSRFWESCLGIHKSSVPLPVAQEKDRNVTSSRCLGSSVACLRQILFPNMVG
ncbi:hypothetical protein M8818_006425 [Zalaria obscura]|uniref:Uncharacterized protein n=1 Tax=Zalaria obscura TaxID=2024903 RepID=A0ACC3S6C5_9PEZI